MTITTSQLPDTTFTVHPQGLTQLLLALQNLPLDPEFDFFELFFFPPQLVLFQQGRLLSHVGRGDARAPVSSEDRSMSR